jgi:hypothetical protein
MVQKSISSRGNQEILEYYAIMLLDLPHGSSLPPGQPILLYDHCGLTSMKEHGDYNH